MNCSRFLAKTLFILLLSGSLLAQTDRQRDSWQQPERIMDSLGVTPGMVIGEAGAGTGYFTVKLSPRVGDEGKIYANDIDTRSLRTLSSYADRNGLDNIEIIVGEETDPLFPDGALDMVIMVYVFHHLDDQVAFMENIKPDLKPGAPVVLVEGDPEKYYRGGHFWRRDRIEPLILAAGYEIAHVMTFLPRDNIFICRLPENE